MKKFKNATAVLLAGLLVLSASPAAVHADFTVIHEEKSAGTITSGAVYEKITRFTTDGWLNINVIKVDLDNPYIKVDTLARSDTLQKLDTTLNLARASGAVAAVNGGFFNWTKDGGYPDGPVIQDGKLISSSSEYNRYNDSMATFALTRLNEVLYSYWKTDMRLTAPNGSSVYVAQLNKPGGDYTGFTVLDRRWSSFSIGADANMPDIVEMVVSGGKVKEIRKAMPPAEIPGDGYVVVTRQDGGGYLSSNFKTGDKVSLDISTTPDFTKIRTAVTGSAILVKDGQIPGEFSMNIAGRHPRTAVGSTSDGKKLIFATVDGRQKSSVGMTQYEMASLMLELGAYNAVNLDGGGSTTMIARKAGSTVPDTVNSPSEGAQRSVSTALGIFSLAPASEPAGLIIEAGSANVFAGASIQLAVKGVDRFHNPVAIDPAGIKWSISGTGGNMDSGSPAAAPTALFRPEKPGLAKITASIGNATGSIELNVLDSPSQLQLDKKELYLTAGQTASIEVTGKDKKGFSTPIRASDLAWTVHGNIGMVKDGRITASGSGTGYIEASFGSAKAFCGVSTAPAAETEADKFEKTNGSFTSYPSTVKGSYSITSEISHSGSSSGKLTYDFTSTTVTRAAYMLLPDGGMQLPKGTTHVGLWVYNPSPVSAWLRVEVADASGRKHLVDMARHLDWTGWKQVYASLEGIDVPERLTRIYAVKTEPEPVSGWICMDDLTFKSPAVFQPIVPSSVPQDTLPVDEAYRPGTLTGYLAGAAGYMPAGALYMPLGGIFAPAAGSNRLNANFAVSINGRPSSSLPIPSAGADCSYGALDIGGSKLIQLDTGSGSLRSANTAQWSWLLNQLAASGGNVFMFLQAGPGSFGDSLEAALLKNVLSGYARRTGKAVWVYYSGDTFGTYMENGVKYISCPAGSPQSQNTDPGQSAFKYMIVSASPTEVAYSLHK